MDKLIEAIKTILLHPENFNNPELLLKFCELKLIKLWKAEEEVEFIKIDVLDNEIIN